MKQTALAIASLFINFGFAQDKKQEDLKAIKSMCGCYEVTFNFAETFKYSDAADYKPSPTKIDRGLEWIELVEDMPNKLVLQHLLIVSDTIIIKHWRQDWEFENTRFYLFDKETSWKFKQLPKTQVKGQWTQRVFQVDDSPRYEGTSSWVHVDGRHYWENTADAPLPRREQTIRNDYNVLKRNNRQEITAFGWVHDQDNDKILRNGGKDQLIAREKGHDVYTRVEDSKCKAAQKYWAENKALWKNVRDKWATVFARNKDLDLHRKVNKLSLYVYLFELAPDTPKTESDKIIDSFVKS